MAADCLSMGATSARVDTKALSGTPLKGFSPFQKKPLPGAYLNTSLLGYFHSVRWENVCKTLGLLLTSGYCCSQVRNSLMFHKFGILHPIIILINITVCKLLHYTLQRSLPPNNKKFTEKPRKTYPRK